MAKNAKKSKVKPRGKQEPAKAPLRTAQQAGGMRASVNRGGKSRTKG
jgi:hypothetical protein